MRSLLVVLCLCVGLVGLGLAPSYAAEKKATASGQQKPEQGQQQMMKSCTDQATAKNLSGDALKSFMDKCMKNG